MSEPKTAEPKSAEPATAEPASAEHTAGYIHPADEHNRRLVGNVHPAGWTNPEPAGRYHLLAIGVQPRLAALALGRCQPFPDELRPA